MACGIGGISVGRVSARAVAFKLILLLNFVELSSFFHFFSISLKNYLKLPVFTGFRAENVGRLSYCLIETRGFFSLRPLGDPFRRPG